MTPWQGQFWPQGYNLKNLGWGLHKWRFHDKYLTSSLCIFRGKDFLSFYNIYIWGKPMTLWGQFTSANIWTTVVEDLLMILYTKYLSSSLKPSDNKIFFKIYYIHITKTYIYDPRGEANFDSRAINLTILVEFRYTMFHDKYLTSSLCQFRGENFKLILHTYKENLWPPGWGQFWPQG
jgi:hypothetical protein